MRRRTLHDRVRWGVTKPGPQPTAADLDARVFSQEYVSKLSGTITRFDVLALEEINAVELGQLRLLSMGVDPDDFELARNHPCETSGDTLRAALEVESTDEWTARQAEFSKRGEGATRQRDVSDAWDGGFSRNH